MWRSVLSSRLFRMWKLWDKYRKPSFSTERWESVLHSMLQEDVCQGNNEMFLQRTSFCNPECRISVIRKTTIFFSGSMKCRPWSRIGVYASFLEYILFFSGSKYEVSWISSGSRFQMDPEVFWSADGLPDQNPRMTEVGCPRILTQQL